MRTSIYAKEASFTAWLSGKRKKPLTMRAVIYDQYGPIGRMVRHVEGTRQNILDQYDFYKCCNPGRILSVVCEDYYHFLIDSYASNERVHKEMA